MLGTELTDAWEIKGISTRAQAKSIMKTVYGSAKTCKQDWTENNIKFTKEDVRAYNKALKDGEIAVGAKFRDFIIENCNPSENMRPNIWGEEFDIECNRFINVGEAETEYDLYDSNSGLPKRIKHWETVKVADLQQFRTFFITLLIHHLDSRVIDVTSEKTVEKMLWALDIHDALILCAESADFAREVYAGELEKIHRDRLEILENYFESIGVTATAAQEWAKVLAVVIPLEEEFKCNKLVLK